MENPALDCHCANFAPVVKPALGNVSAIEFRIICINDFAMLQNKSEGVETSRCEHPAQDLGG